MLGILVIVAFVWFLNWIQSCKRVTMPSGFRDYPGISEFDSLGLDGRVRADGLKIGDITCYRFGEKEDHQVNIGVVIAKAGDAVEVRQGRFLVNGSASEHAFARVGGATTNRAPLIIPADHVFVLNETHKFDSTILGPISDSAIQGKVKSADFFTSARNPEESK
jgi:signal peptidase I